MRLERTFRNNRGTNYQHIAKVAGKDSTFLCFCFSPFLMSPPPPTHIFSLPALCLLALRTTPKPTKVFKLPDFPASLSFHAVQSYHNELIQQLGKAIFSVQNENPTLLARYSAFIIPYAPLVILSGNIPVSLHFNLYNQVFYHFMPLVW